MSAMARNRADANNVMKKYYLQRALGGVGLIVTEATFISPQGFVCWRGGKGGAEDVVEVVAVVVV
jgi:2,4-dienoyl-CoA reductase-like NADH-dependent reductase (Old Yellow Enzyme family)